MARVLHHCQHATGIGHLVRSVNLVRAMARRHEVTLVVGGRLFEGAGVIGPWRTVTLPPLHRQGAGLAGGAADVDLGALMAKRRAIVERAVDESRPDVVLTEHFPFSRWSLRSEIMGLIERARAVNPRVRIVCSLRDIARKSTFDTWDDAAKADVATLDRRYGEEVLPTLNERFDALLVHGDPNVTKLDEQIGWASRIAIPVHHTGYVAGPPSPDGEGRPADAGGGPFVVVSAGGGAEAGALLPVCLDAWQRLGRDGRHAGRRLFVFMGPFADAAGRAAIEAGCDGRAALARPFAADLRAWLRHADLSVSRAGYNTCVNLLETKVRAVLVPSALMADQRLRAERFAALGVAHAVDPERADAAKLAMAMATALDGPPPQHRIALDGAATTAAIVDSL